VVGRLIIISGPVGAGKTTIARDLVASPPEPTAYIEGDTFWRFIVRE
jgi:adenylate kinase family enzyme